MSGAGEVVVQEMVPGEDGDVWMYNGYYDRSSRDDFVASLAGLLPPATRDRFAGEVLGDLGMCESRRARVRYLVGVVVKLPSIWWTVCRRNP